MQTNRLAVHIARRAAGLVGTAALLSVASLAAPGQERVNTVHSFPAVKGDGRTPLATGAANPNDGMIYLTSDNGGTAGKGSVVCLNPNRQGSGVIHSFNGADGAYPSSSLLLVPRGAGLSPYLYGTTRMGGKATTGGPAPQGTIFRITADGRIFQTLHTFTGGSTDGANPYGGLILASDRHLYGTTLSGGKFGLGTVFKANTSGSTVVIHSFAGHQSADIVDGAKPYARLLEFQQGTLIGTTAAGGRSNAGTLFVITPATNVYGVIHHFAGGTADGATPTAGLTVANDSTGAKFLFGTTVSGGTSNGGIAYMCDGSVKFFNVIYNFGAPGDASNPWSDLAFDSATGLLYGTSRAGGAFGDGSVFTLLPAVQSQENLIYSFDPLGTTTDGGAPIGGLVLSPFDGMLYGTCSDQGVNFGGTLFLVVP